MLLDGGSIDNVRPDFQPARARHPLEAGWPSNVWSIGMERLDLLGVDNEGQLYWNGKAIEMRRPLVLTMPQRIGAVLVAVSAIIGAVAAGVSAYADWRQMPAAASQGAQPPR